MKRRGFLGFLGAGAVAAPTVAKNALSSAYPVTDEAFSLVNSLPRTPIGYGPITEAEGGVLSTLDRIRKLERLISGEEQEEENPYTEMSYRRMAMQAHINSLGSVSQCVKVRMVAEEIRRLDREENKALWIRELLGLKKSM